jgi:SAM-dependent methyltransferase
MDARAFYDDLGHEYDVMVSWAERLAREEAFFRRVFDANGARSALDAACGTGMHAIAFARQGLRCAGADLSPAMIDKARENARAAGVSVRFEICGFGGLSRLFSEPFEAVTCLGNSLPHLPDDETLAAALGDFASVLAPGGVLVIQNRNYDRVLREKTRFMPVTSRTDDSGETLFLRITDFLGGESLSFSIVTLRKRNGAWGQTVKTTPLRAMRRETLENALHGAGFRSVETYGSFAFAPFDAPGTGDLIAVAKK